MSQFILALDNVRSTHNVGSLFRSADVFGVDKIILGGITPDPIDRFGRLRPDIAKVALGAESTTGWEHAPELLPILQTYRGNGFLIYALEQSDTSIDVGSLAIPDGVPGVVLIVGNEVDGVSTEILNTVDAVIEIAQAGTKESLNVSVAGGIALFQCARVLGTI